MLLRSCDNLKSLYKRIIQQVDTIDTSSVGACVQENAFVACASPNHEAPIYDIKAQHNKVL